MYALCSNLTATRATIRALADSPEELRLSPEELAAEGIQGSLIIVQVADDAEICDRIWRGDEEEKWNRP